MNFLVSFKFVRFKQPREQENQENAQLDHLCIQYRVTLHIWQILHSHQHAASIGEILKHGNEVDATLGELLESTYAVNATHVDVTPEEPRVKAATKTAVSVQNENRNGRRTPATGNPASAPKKRRGMSMTPKTPVKRRAAPVIDDEQEVTPISLSTSKKEAPGSGLFEDSDKFFQLLGTSSSEPSDC